MSIKIGLASYKLRNNDIPFNLNQIEKTFIESKDKVDLLCFGECFLQGFDSLNWQFDNDKEIAIQQDSNIITNLKELTIKYNTALAIGYFEKDNDIIYSSYIVINHGIIIHNYRRISKGWKYYQITDNHYQEGNEISSFKFKDKDIIVGLCGDLWDYPEKFKTNNLLIWPVYVNFSLDQWKNEIIEYANQASKISNNVLMINSLDDNPINHGGSFYFKNGKIEKALPFDQEGVLIINYD